MNSAEVRTQSPGDAAERAAETAPLGTSPAPVQPAPVLITAQEVLLGSAAAGAVDLRPRWILALRRVFSSSDWRVDEHRSYPPRQSYLENGRMSREMRHL